MSLGLSLSLGAVVHRSGEALPELLERSDALLYKAKKRGGACVVWDNE